MKRLIFTVAMGKTFERFAKEITLAPMRRYACKVKSDFIKWDKFFINRNCSYLTGISWAFDQGYDQVLYLDADVLIKDHSQNVFDIEFDKIAMRRSRSCNSRLLKDAKKYINPEFDSKYMYNSGVILMNRKGMETIIGYMDQISHFVKEHDRLGEQICMCSLFHLYNDPPTEMEKIWNAPPFKKHDKKPNFIHFMGKKEVKFDLYKRYKRNNRKDFLMFL